MASYSLQNVFEIRCLLQNINIKQSCRIENGVKQLLALITSASDILFHYTYGELCPVLKRVPWFTDNTKEIQTICFDPTATWLLAVTLDGSLYIIPALSLVDKKQKIDCKWSLNDLTHFPKHAQTPDSKPLSIVWWQTLDSNQNALVGFENGIIGLISLTDGRYLGSCNIGEAVIKLYLCQDNTLDCVFLLINGKSGQQWRLILEQHSTGYLWPPESNLNSTDGSAASRLLSLKQMGVDTFVSLKQRLSDARGARRDSQNSETASDSSHSESAHTGLELLPHLCDTFFSPQYARNRYLFSAFYKPNNLLTVHAVNLESAPLYVYKLNSMSSYLLLTNRLIYVVNEGLDSLSVISTHLSECRLEGDTEFNPESLVAHFNFSKENEKIINIYKLSDTSSFSERQNREEMKREKDRQNVLPKSMEDLNIRKPKIDTCVVVTNSAVYKVTLSTSPTTKFINAVIKQSDLEMAERLCVIFGLNSQELLESCGDLLVSSGSYHQGLILYKQAKVHLLKRVLKLAVSEDCRALLKFVHLCLTASKVDMSTATKIHMGNLAVMGYTELVLRHGGLARFSNTKDFMNFLRYEEFYDQILAVNVACQAGLWNIVTLLAKSRGLQPEVIAVLCQTVQSPNAPNLTNHDFFITLSEPSLSQSLLMMMNNGFCDIILHYIRTNLENFPEDILHRLVVQLDPSQPCAYPLVRRLFQKRKKISTSIESTIDSVDMETPDRINISVEEFIETFICVLIELVAKSSNKEYNIELLSRIEPSQREIPVNKVINKFPNVHPLSCGYEHAAVVRNGNVYTMGVAASGCLGLGPMLTQSSPPKLVQTLSELKLKVLSVSCGRKHTLALSNAGVYAWGSNSYGQLGVGPLVQDTPYPQVISALSGCQIIDIVAGQYHSIALNASGKVYTWGWGIHGQLGHGNCNCEYVPKLLDFDEVVVQISAGHAHTLVLTKDGKVYGFGSNAFGQLESNNLEGSKTSSPVWVLVMPEMYTPIEKIATAYFHNIAVRVDQEVYTWGASPQEVRLSQSKQGQKLTGIGTKLFEPWKSSMHIYTGSNHKPIEQVAVGFRHSAVLHNGKLFLGKNLDEELSPPKVHDQDALGILSQRFLHVSCGPDYTMAMDHSGKLLAWGNSSMAQTLLGKPQEEDQKQGRMVILKNTKRIIKIPHNLQSSSEAFPIEVPGLPTMAITYNSPDPQTLFTKPYKPYTIHSVENETSLKNTSHKQPYKNSSFEYNEELPQYTFGHKTLHYALELYFGHYDTETVLEKCLQVGNYQAASKIAILDGHFGDSLGFQLTAFKKYLEAFTLDFTPVTKSKTNGYVHKENLETFDHYNKKTVYNNKAHGSPARILSTSSSLDSIQQWTDDSEDQGGRESPCSLSDLGDIRQNITQYMQAVKTDGSPPISSVSKLVSEHLPKSFGGSLKDDFDIQIRDANTRDLVKIASHLVEFYIQETYASENHILMQNILLKCIEFWLSNNLPVPILENVLLKNMDKYFYPLSILLFCKNFNNNLGEEIVRKEDLKHQNSSGFLKEFSTKFCLQLCSMVLENVNKA